MHAELLKQAGAAEIFEQTREPNDLLPLIEKVINHLEQYKKGFISLKKLYRKDAAQTITNTILHSE